jgi:integrase
MARRGLLPFEGNGRDRKFRRADVLALLERFRKGASPSTCNHYATAIKGFSRWLKQQRRISFDPMDDLEKLNEDVDVRRKRRSMAPEMFAKLLEAAIGGNPFRGLAGADRSILYLFASNTGFRAKELRSLVPASFDLRSQVPTVTVAAPYSKHRRPDVQILRGDLADVMRLYLAGKPADQPLWPGTWWKDVAEMLRLDLEAAGIPYEDAAGVFDFHGTRHKFISDLAAGGVHPKVAQNLARHSTITLTMDHYTHLELHDHAAALDNLPEISPAVNTPDPAVRKEQDTGAA